jgi:hypothetical protein
MNDKPFHSKHHAADVLQVRATLSAPIRAGSECTWTSHLTAGALQMLFYMVRASGLKALLSPLQVR